MCWFIIINSYHLCTLSYVDRGFVSPLLSQFIGVASSESPVFTLDTLQTGTVAHRQLSESDFSCHSSFAKIENCIFHKLAQTGL